MKLQAIDAHVAGSSVRLIVDGFPSPRGRTMIEKQTWCSRHADRLRRVLLHEPRGHKDMIGVVLTEPVDPGSHAGLLFMDNGDFGALSAQGAMAAVAIALDRGVLVPGGDATGIVADTPAGTVRLRVGERIGSSGRAMTLVGVTSFVVRPGVEVSLRLRRIRADIAACGSHYAIVDSEAAGLAIDGAHVPELRRVGVEIAEVMGTAGTVFTGPPSGADADLRCATVLAHGAVDRSPSGTGVSAVMAVLSAMGLLTDGQRLVVEGLVGTAIEGRVVGRTVVGEADAIVPEVSASVWITAELMIAADEDDPIGDGFDL